MQYDSITSRHDLQSLCRQLEAASTIAFDTEFVSEDSYRPQLCLIQVAAEERLAVIDPLRVAELTPFWELLASPDREVIVHSGREELRFLLRAIGRRPPRLFDVQIAAGFVGLEFPASYGNLISKLLGVRLAKGETRTDWRRRPLSDRQLDYAVQDVLHLNPLRQVLGQRLAELERTSWLESETQLWQEEIEAYESREQWRRVSGISGLGPRELAVVRELWRWREEEARRRDRPPRRVLRDDLIIELARRRTADPKRIRAIRGLERRGLQSQLGEIAQRIAGALELDDSECPRHRRPSRGPSFQLLGQFLTTALSSICRTAQIAPGLVGTAQDVRELIAFRLLGEQYEGSPPKLLRGWRAKVVGETLDDLLGGRLAVHVARPLDEQPLAFETRPADTPR